MKLNEIEPGMWLKDLGIVLQVIEPQGHEMDGIKLVEYIEPNDLEYSPMVAMVGEGEDLVEVDSRGSHEWCDLMREFVAAQAKSAAECLQRKADAEKMLELWSAGPPAVPGILEH